MPATSTPVNPLCLIPVNRHPSNIEIFNPNFITNTSNMSFDMDMDNLFDFKSTSSMSPSSVNPTWESRYEELLRWRSEKGDTCVPKAEGALGRWVARQRELKRTGKLGPEREDKLNAISFVWNTVTAMWEERFRRLKEWKRVHGHCAVPIAQGELGTWVSKQRQLRKRGKLSKEKVDALDSLQFTWSTAEADWEDKFKRLCEWTRERGHASVPFNEGELGWWVNTQRQCKRKGKLSAVREARLQSLGFVWNPSNSRSRASAQTATASSSTDTTPTWTPEKGLEKEFSEEETNHAMMQLFGPQDESVVEGSPVSAELAFGCVGQEMMGKQDIDVGLGCEGQVLGVKQEREPGLGCDGHAVMVRQEQHTPVISSAVDSLDHVHENTMVVSTVGAAGPVGVSAVEEGMGHTGIHTGILHTGILQTGIGQQDVLHTGESPDGQLLCESLWLPTMLSSPLMNGVNLAEMAGHVMEGGEVGGSNGNDQNMPPPLNFF